MKKPYRQGQPPEDPFAQLQSEVASLRSEVVAFHLMATEELKGIRSALGDIQRALEEKDVS